MTTLFISDLHLCEERPSISALFAQFMNDIAPGAKALYILGDLFEHWLGDDQLDHDPLARDVASRLAKLAAEGTEIFFMHGNRDFVVGPRFASEAGLTLLADPTVITTGDDRFLLLHGDTLCTDDVAYQQFRKQVRNPAWQAVALAKPYAEREQIARSIRQRSDVEKSIKAEAIMDVNADAVSAAFAEHQYPIMIHGHTHRPAKHELIVDGQTCIRWVLQDWHDFGGYLAMTGAHNTLTAHLLGANTN
ncbi:MAG: UDP-2,3-diacylglucosamine diphosphatase [Betaproteobacteria bacterium]